MASSSSCSNCRCRRQLIRAIVDAFLAQIASLQETGLLDPASAFATWGRILSEDGSDEEAVRELERLAQLGGEYGELAQIFEQRLEASSDPEVQRTFALKAGWSLRNASRRPGQSDRSLPSGARTAWQ